MTNKEKIMEQDLQEQACWLLLTYESGLTTRIINEIIVTWCQQLGRTLQEFFAVDSQVWSDTCHLSAPIVEKLSGVEWRALLEKIETGKVLLLSQFHPDAPWVVSRAMERNKVVTGLAQIVIVAESDVQGGTWAGATGALRQNRPLYVRDTASSSTLPGNKALIELGGHPLPWPTEQLADVLSPLIQKSATLRQVKDDEPSRPDQLSLFVGSGE